MQHRDGGVEAEELGVQVRSRLSVAAGVLSRDLDARLARRVPRLEFAVHLFFSLRQHLQESDKKEKRKKKDGLSAWADYRRVTKNKKQKQKDGSSAWADYRRVTKKQKNKTKEGWTQRMGRRAGGRNKGRNI